MVSVKERSVFVTSDEREFLNKQEAEAHQESLDLTEEFKNKQVDSIEVSDNGMGDKELRINFKGGKYMKFSAVGDDMTYLQFDWD